MIQIQKELFERIYVATMGPDSKRVIIKYFTRDPTNEFNIISKLDHPNLVKYMSLYYGSQPTHRTLRNSTNATNATNSVNATNATNATNAVTPVNGVNERATSTHRPRAIIMEYYSYGDLYDYFMKQKLTLSMIRNILRQLVSVLCYLHQNHIAHRDVKLENIFLRDHPLRDNSVVLGDFELMSRWSPEIKLTQLVGTLNYQAPELFSSGGTYHGPELDVWSTGVVAYTLLTGNFPFHDDDDDATIQQILNEPIYLPPTLPNTAQDLLTRMLDRNHLTRISMSDVAQHPFLTQPSTGRASNRPSNYTPSITLATPDPVTHVPPVSLDSTDDQTGS
jgi:serine/threonine protein kinase